MGKFDGYLICTDLDGTFCLGHELCGENAKYVKYFQENGGLFTASTGRLPNHLDAFSDFTPNCPAITYNGAAIYDTSLRKMLYKRALPSDWQEVAEYIRKNAKQDYLHIHSEKESWHFDGISNEIRDDALKIVTNVAPPSRAVAFRDELKEKFGDRYCIFLGWDTGIEILAKGTNKGSAVRELRRILGDRVQRVICVGDSESDGFMMREADIGYAVANADEAAKAAADRITVDFREGFVKSVIGDIEAELSEMQ